MKKISFLLLGVLMMTNASAAEYEYVPLVREGVLWEYVGIEQQGSFIEFNLESLYTLELNGTTTVDGLVYYNMYRTNYDLKGNPQEPYLVTCLREENKVVTSLKNDYVYTGDTDYFDTLFYWCEIPGALYDFNKPMFLPNLTPFEFYDVPYPYDYNNCSQIELGIGETIRKGYNICNDGALGDFKTIEGIGVDCMFGDLLVPFRHFSTGMDGNAGLSAVYENGELVYKGCMYDVAQRLKHKKADVDGDGDVTSADVTAIYNFLLGNSREVPASYDVDGDGVVTTADITAIYNVILGLQ